MTESRLFTLVSGTVKVAATTTPFVARDHFVENIRREAPVKIFYVADVFKEWFLGKEEKPFEGAFLRYNELSFSSVDGFIIAELGGEVETTLAELFLLMERQKNSGKRSPLKTDGSNVFYIRDGNGVLRAVFARWSCGSWRVGANSVANPRGQRRGHRIFSRDSR